MKASGIVFNVGLPCGLAAMNNWSAASTLVRRESAKAIRLAAAAAASAAGAPESEVRAGLRVRLGLPPREPAAGDNLLDIQTVRDVFLASDQGDEDVSGLLRELARQAAADFVKHRQARLSPLKRAIRRLRRSGGRRGSRHD